MRPKQHNQDIPTLIGYYNDLRRTLRAFIAEYNATLIMAAQGARHGIPKILKDQINQLETIVDHIDKPLDQFGKGELRTSLIQEQKKRADKPTLWPFQSSLPRGQAFLAQVLNQDEDHPDRAYLLDKIRQFALDYQVIWQTMDAGNAVNSPNKIKIKPSEHQETEAYMTIKSEDKKTLKKLANDVVPSILCSIPRLEPEQPAAVIEMTPMDAFNQSANTSPKNSIF